MYGISDTEVYDVWDREHRETQCMKLETLMNKIHEIGDTQGQSV